MSIPNWGNLPDTSPTESEWRAALAAIESQELDISLNVVSDYASFFRAVSRESAIRVLVNAMLASGDAQEEAIGRLHDLARLDVDTRYQNPCDTALAILLWATYFTAPYHVYNAANAVHGSRMTWYSRKFAGHVMNPAPNSSGNVPAHREGRPDFNSQATPGTFDVWPKETSSVYSAPLRWDAGTAGP